jgi:hypothetical protein
MVNVNQTNWDVMLSTFWWAYQMAYKVTTQHKPCKLEYGLMPLLLWTSF